MSDSIHGNNNITQGDEDLVPRTLTVYNPRKIADDDDASDDNNTTSAERSSPQDQQDQEPVPQFAKTSILSSSSCYSNSAVSDVSIEDPILSDQASLGNEAPSQVPLNPDNTDHEDPRERQPSQASDLPKDKKSCPCGAAEEIAYLREELSDNWRAWKDLVKALMKDDFTELGNALLEGLGLDRKYLHIDSDSDEGKGEDSYTGHSIANEAASDTNVENGKFSISLSEFEGKEQRMHLAPPRYYFMRVNKD
jgi:hypothetical protein